MDDILSRSGFWFPVGEENLMKAAMSHPALRSLTSYFICAVDSLTYVNVARTWIWTLTFVSYTYVGQCDTLHLNLLF